MPTYLIYATEKVYYLKEVEANSREELSEQIKAGNIFFEGSDITDGEDFKIDDIEEIKR
jgi:hypothetical protein